MQKVMVGDNNPNALLDAFSKTVNTGVDTTMIRDKFLMMVEHLGKFYDSLNMFAKINKHTDIELYSVYAASEVRKFAWKPEFTVKHLMKNFQNQSIINECKEDLARLINCCWTVFCVKFMSNAQEWANEMFTKTTDKHLTILTPIKRPAAKNVEIASRMFSDPLVIKIFPFDTKLDADSEIDMYHELVRLRQLDCRDVLLPTDFGRIVDARANSNFISVVNLIFNANDVINDIYTPDISPEMVRDFINMGFQRIMDRGAKRHNRAHKFIERKSDLFQQNFHKYYREYVNSGSMMVFMTEFMDDVNSSIEGEENDNLSADIDSFQKMIFNKLQNDPAFSQHLPVINSLKKKTERNEVTRDTQEQLRKLREGRSTGHQEH